MTGKIRIIAGQWRGRKISVADRPGLRPTGDRARETLFNWIGPRIVGARVLDLFAGSGALGLEAASRGASRVVLVERDAAAVRALREGALTWPGAEAVNLVEADAPTWLMEQRDVFDLVLVDPPFESALLSVALAVLSDRPDCLSENALVYVESSPDQLPACWPNALDVFRQKRLGQAVLTLLKRTL
ncbi:16S rRNA (guanine(966)-N(2))-methyltransferase RsmD [Wenzhouxiangella limi]|uniref:Ribosomal RNA small subunit methyltransferase D n=1 Tax=Wenzhouxiangella limi TaxID=2707351 RepID=A0A845V2I8_9GAMM|nr:16S rRNA (guanine(966)-N(2))-methyltransferase RsmD [Wenzhouxiangella limi]NDY95466.1 16S rRNA (guanine(966)-N(2))-methyltransferase RsmD [Wenzhouxiangella limi]